MTPADCLPRSWPRLSPSRVAEIVAWNRAHPAWVAGHTLGNCVRAAALAGHLVGPGVAVVGGGGVTGIPISEQYQRSGLDMHNSVSAEINGLGETPMLPRPEDAAGTVASQTAQVGSKWQAVGGSPTPIRTPLPPHPDLQIPRTDAPQDQARPVPEPSTLAMLGVWCIAVGLLSTWGRR